MRWAFTHLLSSDSAAKAANLVGYESPTQFSREYARMSDSPASSGYRPFKDSLVIATPELLIVTTSLT
jgi:hypothetical protein